MLHYTPYDASNSANQIHRKSDAYFAKSWREHISWSIVILIIILREIHVKCKETLLILMEY